MRRGARARVSRIAALEGEELRERASDRGTSQGRAETETGNRERELPAYGLIALSDWPWAA
jgi:hypothetical protein